MKKSPELEAMESAYQTARKALEALAEAIIQARENQTSGFMIRDDRRKFAGILFAEAGFVCLGQAN